jgi:hypothetical protein
MKAQGTTWLDRPLVVREPLALGTGSFGREARIMKLVATELEITPTNQPKKEAVKFALRTAWKGPQLPSYLSNAMATLVREPESKLGRAKEQTPLKPSEEPYRKVHFSPYRPNDAPAPDDAPAFVSVGQYTMTPDGLRFDNKWVCGPLKIIGRARDPAGERWARYIRWRDEDGRSHKDAIGDADLHSDVKPLCADWLTEVYRLSAMAENISPIISIRSWWNVA